MYRTSDAMLLTAVYVDAKTASWNRDSIVLDTGLTLTDEGWHDADGQQQTVARPMQLLMRWYGAAATFTDCEVWEGIKVF